MRRLYHLRPDLRQCGDGKYNGYIEGGIYNYSTEESSVDSFSSYEENRDEQDENRTDEFVQFGKEILKDMASNVSSSLSNTNGLKKCVLLERDLGNQLQQMSQMNQKTTNLPKTDIVIRRSQDNIYEAFAESQILKGQQCGHTQIPVICGTKNLRSEYYEKIEKVRDKLPQNWTSRFPQKLLSPPTCKFFL